MTVPTTDGAAALAVLDALREAGVDYAVLHGAERLEQPGVLSDVDIVVARPPESVIAEARSALRRKGLLPVVVWPYDIGGSATVFLVDESARSGVQLDMLHDPQGLGRYRIRSGDLVSEIPLDEASPSLVDPDRLVYLWVKRRSKGQDGRLGEVAAALRDLDPAAVGEAARRLLTRDDWIAEITGEPAHQAGRWRAAAERTLLRGRRIAARLTSPVGFWAHLAGDDGEVAAEAAKRFARVLVVAKAVRAPAGRPAAVWYATEVVPVRLRPGLVVSYGIRPRAVPAPDLELGAALAVDDVVAELVRSMHRRLTR